MRRGATVMVALAVLLAAAQMVPVARLSTPADDGDLSAPPAVKRVLVAACYDCHSNHPRRSWYGRIAPLSWIVVRHVSAARERLNFSDWSDYASDPGTLAHKLDQIGSSIADGTMAPWYYRLLHREARLDDRERAAITAWIARGAPGEVPAR